MTMTVAITYSRAAIGIQAPLITVEADISTGLPQVVIVGLPETAVKESKDRVKSAIINTGFSMPNKRVTINLSPADLPKSGGRYDVAIAISILAAMEIVPVDSISRYVFLGELALNGDIRFVNGILPATIQNLASEQNLVVPNINSQEAALVEPDNVYRADSLSEIVRHLKEKTMLPPLQPSTGLKGQTSRMELSDIRGQLLAKRALTIAAAGGHNIIFVGPPGSGKTMLASRLPSLVPPMSIDQSLATASIQSVSKYSFDNEAFGCRPFRTPHHTISAVALVGGGNPPKPGEISLAHNGVLFLDELPEFPRHVLEVLREPLESGKIIISRANHQVSFPANFQLVAAMNPCPCGYYGDNTNRCECTNDKILRYRSKVSGPLLDRIDIHIDVPSLPSGTLSDPRFAPKDEEHDKALKQVNTAHAIMMARSRKLNSELSNRDIDEHCTLEDHDQKLLDSAMMTLGLSARGYYKILKVARTIADIDGQVSISTMHLTEALGFRKLDRYQTAGMI